MNLKVEIKNIKNISHCIFDFPIEKGIYCLAGKNGSGKSTILSCLAQTVYQSSINRFNSFECSKESFIKFEYDNNCTIWDYTKEEWSCNQIVLNRIRFNGMYEGSLFYGTRFDDSLRIDSLVADKSISRDSIVDADNYIKEKMSYILHGDFKHYSSLKRIRNRSIAEEVGLSNIPYFIEINNNLISQYRMSSGECLLVSLLHFIYNALIRKSLPTNKPILMLIDEIELALHPVAVSRLIDLLQEIIADHNSLTVLLTSHSPEVIRKISPNNLYILEEDNGIISLSSPCYPSYAIRDVYMHDGFDYIIFVEDLLAKYIVEHSIRKLGLCNSRLINVLPVGGWKNVLQFQHESYITNTFGVGTKLFSILDGDVESIIPMDYTAYPKLFLPINSVEKYLRNIIVDNSNAKIKKEINDTFFSVESIDNILVKYNSSSRSTDNNGKALYRLLMNNIRNRRISEESFIKELSEIIIKYVSFDAFETRLKNMLQT